MSLNLSEKIKEIKSKIKPIENDIILALVIALVAFISFGLGRLSKIRDSKTPIKIENIDNAGANIISSQNMKSFVASKNGAKYHYPWCPGAVKIGEQNKIWFSTAEEAEKAGYQPASNCKGL